ncbi:hypothetical protein B0T09DRAFT_128711 [Sordaria sp. MPI-SDFR-AT-0083]|nr:hypothetical protein B0T09DRAFT_128711 [Sordaria sp. MPI-SDFR-AT-0083]
MYSQLEIRAHQSDSLMTFLPTFKPKSQAPAKTNFYTSTHLSQCPLSSQQTPPHDTYSSPPHPPQAPHHTTDAPRAPLPHTSFSPTNTPQQAVTPSPEVLPDRSFLIQRRPDNIPCPCPLCEQDPVPFRCIRMSDPNPSVIRGEDSPGKSLQDERIER